MERWRLYKELGNWLVGSYTSLSWRALHCFAFPIISLRCLSSNDLQKLTILTIAEALRPIFNKVVKKSIILPHQICIFLIKITNHVCHLPNHRTCPHQAVVQPPGNPWRTSSYLLFSMLNLCCRAP